MENQVLINKSNQSRITLATRGLTEYQFKKAVEYFNTIDKHHWNQSKKLWSFPAAELDAICEKMESLDINVKEYQPEISITKENDVFTITLSDYCQERAAIFRSTQGVEYENGEWKAPISSLPRLLKILNTENFKYTELERESSPRKDGSNETNHQRLILSSVETNHQR
jgi:hypothetical protein